ncbi:cell surface protein SprA [Bacteroidota bacterium]
MKLRPDNIVPYTFLLLLVLLFNPGGLSLHAGLPAAYIPVPQQPDTILPFPINVDENSPFPSSTSSPLYLNSPRNIQPEIVYDPVTDTYVFSEKIGTWNYRTPKVLSISEFQEYQYNKSVQDYWDLKSGNAVAERLSFIPSINLGGEAFDKVFGSNTINIIPTGSAELIFGFNYSMIDNPNISERLRRTPSFQFDEKILMNVNGSIGDKFQMDFKYNTEATFDFDQKTKLEYAGEEDEIVKKIEAGNVSLPLQGSLINGSMSLFGLKTEMQFGKLRVTSVFSQQRGESEVIEASGGAQISDFGVTVDEYDVNKHFFLSEYFRVTYNDAMHRLPVITSDVTITRIEVWVTNKTTNFEESRNILGVIDLGEARPHNDLFTSTAASVDVSPKNAVNDAYKLLTSTYSAIREIKNATGELEAVGLQLGVDFEKIENARLLSPREYQLNEKLGYISLNSALNSDEVLAVAYEYNYRGQSYTVGEMSTSSGVSAPSTLILKLIRPSNFTPRSYTWDLMMKNVYAIGAFQVQQAEFSLDVMYRDDKTGNNINYLPEGELNKSTLLSLFNLDNMNSQKDPYPDGVFDYLSGITILPGSGRVIFPLLEPFGSDLEKILRDSLPPEEVDILVDKYVFQELYDSTKTKAQQIAEKNKFMLVGTYSSSSSSEIMLNAMNVPEGSVKVSAGGRELVEGQDYTVDYTLGRVTIINQGILESGTPVKIALENQSLFNFQTKTMVGSHLDYKISNNFNIGGTILHLTERPHTQKVNIGDEPISNTIWGLNTSYSRPAPLLTTIVDKLPFIETKAPSQLTVIGEFAHLIPGHSRAIEKEGNAYIDDFEASETSIDMKHYSAWHLASTPRGFFPEADLNNNREYGYGRAKFAWYQIEPLFLANRASTPQHIKANPDLQSSPYVYELLEKDIFPNKENKDGVPTRISVLNVAYYPKERGPYNYDYENIDRNGNLLNPEMRWGGIMREIYSSDFEAANVEFIEFWIMDPYAGMSDRSGGELYFNLGNVSEDILKDSRKMFENGLPPGENLEKIDTTTWGRVPVVQSLVNAFDSDPVSRQYQDVGLDGLNNEDERSFFSSEEDDFLVQIENLFTGGDLTTQAYEKILDDPSSDDYHFYRGSDYDLDELDIIDRYKHFNNLEGNSPSDVDNPESYATSGTTLPDIEDINRDNTLSEGESYFVYRVDLSASEFEVGRNYIVDKVIDNVEYPNGESQDIAWYQFRIPIRDYQQAVGGITDFKTIRFMRMFLSGFEDTVLLRFAKLELVRGEWRRYNLPFMQGGEDWTGIEPPEGILAISAVNIEENAGKEPVNYVLPPGFNRQIDPTQPQLRQLNEQSIVLKVLELGDGDARAAYKNTELDIRQYKKIKMEAHAEALIDGNLDDKELTAFLRIGSDYQGNYYEYELPLMLTPPGLYDNETESDREIVWPEENKFEIDLSMFTRVKQERNRAMADPNTAVSTSSVYSIYDDRGNKVSVSGNPNMSSIRTIMIGVRNPKKGSNLNTDDGLPKSGEIWLNELRLTDFDESGGWAANGRATARLADLGTLTFAGSTSTPGFGSIEQKVNERQREQVLRYDVSSNIEMGKFFNEEAGVSIPVYMGYSKSVVNPEYNPLDPDIRLKEAIDNARDQLERDSIKRYSQDLVERKSIALTNLRIMPAGSQPKIYSLSNWSTSLSLNEVNSTNPNLEYFATKRLKGNVSYNFNNRPKNIQPFSKVKFLSSKWFRFIKDFNFYYLPSRLSFRTDMDRAYMEKQTRNINNPDFIVKPTFKKDFFWNRDYNLKFDLTKTLKFDFTASNTARIDEPEGRYNRETDYYEAYRDSIWQNIRNFGRTTAYYHQFNLSYTLPINKIPLFDWITLNSRYSGTYGWDAGPIVPDDPVFGSIELGNTIKNSYTIQFNGQMNFVNLYNKSGYLKSINDKFRQTRRATTGRMPTPSQSNQQEEVRTKEKTFEQSGLYFREGTGRFVTHNLKTENITVILYDENGQEVENDIEVLSDRRIRVSTPTTLRNARIVVTGTINKGKNPIAIIAENGVRMMMAVRTVNLTYSRSGGTLLPGFLPETRALGMQNIDNKLVPGWEYVSGWYKSGFAEEAFHNGWLTYDQALNDPFNMNLSEVLNFRANIEPLKGLKIDLTGNMTRSENTTEFFTSDEFGNLPSENERGRVRDGSYSTSFLSWGTAFEKFSENADSSSASFDYLKNNARTEISARLADEYFNRTGSRLADSAGYYGGYGPTSQEVLIPAFLAAYGYKESSTVPLGAVQSFLNIMPNWKITYNGLSDIEALKEYINSITINHAYRSTYTVGSYTSNPYYLVDNSLGVPIAYDLQGNFMVEQNINTVTISEQFSPLINVDMDWENSLTTRFEVKKSRTIGLNMANTQVNEVRSNEYVFGAGYRFNSVQLIINNNEINSDLNVRIDFSYRNNATVIRKLEDISGSEITAGQEILSIKATADYMLSEKFTLRAFYDQRINKPHISNSYDNANYNVGFSLTFSL